MFNKRNTRTFLMLFAVVMFTFALVTPGRAQNATPPLILDDTTPSIDAVITPVQGATGVVMLEMEGVRVQLTTGTNVNVLTATDARIQAFAFQFAAGAAPHTLKIERLPGVRVGRVNILPQTALPVVVAANSTTPITTLDNPTSGTLNVAPRAALPIISTTTANLFSAQVSAESTIQLADKAGQTLFTIQAGSGIQAIAAKLAPGTYLANIANKDTKAQNTVTVALSNHSGNSLGTETAEPTITGTQVVISTRRPTSTPRPQSTVRATDDHGGRGGGNDDGPGHDATDDHGGRGGGNDDGGGHDSGDDKGGHK